MFSLIHQCSDRIPAAQQLDEAGNALEEPPENLEEPSENPAMWLWVQLGQRRTKSRAGLPAAWQGENRDQRKKAILISKIPNHCFRNKKRNTLKPFG